MTVDVGAELPWLFLDVDGPLNPFAGMPHDCPPGYRSYRLMPPSWEKAERERLSAWGRQQLAPVPLPVWLNPTHGALLAALPFRLAWASTWGEEANAFISPLLGLPPLPCIEWSAPRRARAGGLLWKTPELVAWAGGCSFAWLDDEVSDADRAWVTEHHAGPALLHYVNPQLGLQSDDFEALRQWADSHS
ncbi:hypothetical protein [Streptacidiphilus monticola]|uniref:Secreted protein n=1 Tax=Streptacidiphilus monticola TaxID=2161674 RepID=A0ABW1G6P7_9ACTN